MPDQGDQCLVDYEGILMLLLPVVTYEAGQPRSVGTLSCFVLDRQPPPGSRPKPPRWTLMPVVDEEGNPRHFSTFDNAVEEGFAYGELWLRGKV